MVNVKPSVLASRVRADVPARWSGASPDAANPASVGAATRARAPLSVNAPPTVMNPKLNTTPWSTAYAVNRTPMPKSKSKRMRKG